MDGQREVIQSLIGHTIVRAEWDDGEGPQSTGQGDETGRIWLDDGRVFEFGAWGHDYWGATINEIEVVDVDKCLHCGKPHKDARITGGWEFDSDGRLPKTPFAWCSDGNHAAWIAPVEDRV